MQKKELRNRIPMKLQFFADGAEGGVDPGAEGGNEAPTMDQLIERIAALETANAQKDAEIMQWKNSSDKASSQAADFKRQLRARMTAQEQADQAKKEADDAIQNELATLRKKIALTEAAKRYMKLGMDEATAEATATAEVSGDMEGVSKNFGSYIEAVKRAEFDRFVKERPEFNAGHSEEDTDPAVELARKVRRESGTNKQIDRDALKAFM